MMPDASGSAQMVVVHYHEISLKRGNRPLFLRRLQESLYRALDDLGPLRIEQLTGRIALHLEAGTDPEAVVERIARVFAERTPPDMEALKRAVDRVTEGRRFASFRITARRAFKTLPLTSLEMNRALGAHVLGRHQTRVSLEHPELNVHVEVLPGQAFVYGETSTAAFTTSNPSRLPGAASDDTISSTLWVTLTGR